MARTQLLRLLRFLVRQLMFARSILLVLLYSLFFLLSLFLGYQLRFDFNIEPPFLAQFYNTVFWIIGLKLLLMFLFGQFGVLLSYFRLPDIYRLAGALGLSSLILIVAWYSVPEPSMIPPRSVILSDFVFSLFLIVAFRTSLRIARERYFNRDPERSARDKRVAIVGAGETGASIASNILSRPGSGLRPVVFLDDDQRKWRMQIHGIPVVDTPESLPFVKARYGVEGIIIAMPKAPAKRIREITEVAQKQALSVDIVPSFTELATGRVRASRVRPVEIQDLLGRDEVSLDTAQIRNLIEDKVVVVTGAGGSIGSELCLQIASRNPKRLILVEQCEVQLFHVESLLNEAGFSGILLPLIADVLDQERMQQIFATYHPQIVFHAAAHKHVPIMERQPGEALKNNSLGTAALCELARQHKVERFIFISTDKAINPTNIMGASKRLAEIYLQSLFHANPDGTKFMAVRFGNVLGSSGSVIPVFRKQIANGGPVTVTHPEVTRYFMTIPEAVGLVLQCATQGQGGEIFVLDMGTPVKIIDLARQMIELSGFRPNEDIEIKFVGLRPGEKLYEELRHHNESHTETEHARIFRFTGAPYQLATVQTFFTQLRQQVDTEDRNTLKRAVQDFVPEYTPYLD